jgi:hypothetical protein
VRRGFYEEVDPRFGHDLSFPYRMVRRGKRAVYVADAVATEKMSTDLEDEFRRKVRMFGHCWLLVLQGRMFSLRRLGPLYWLQMVSHRLLRYASGLLHLALLGTRSPPPCAAIGARAAWWPPRACWPPQWRDRWPRAAACVRWPSPTTTRS